MKRTNNLTVIWVGNMDATIERNRLIASIEPKSDQINYDDLVAGSRTFTVAGVSAGNGEQPVNVRLKDEPRYFRPCKSMRRLLIYAWGDDGHTWVGRSMTLVGDPNVSFGGVKVGGVRISHISHIDGPLEVALTVTRGKRAPYRVLPLKTQSAGESPRTEPPVDSPEESSAPPTSDPPGTPLDEKWLWSKAGEIADLEGSAALKAWFSGMTNEAKTALKADEDRWGDIKARAMTADKLIRENPLGA